MLVEGRSHEHEERDRQDDERDQPTDRRRRVAAAQVTAVDHVVQQVRHTPCQRGDRRGGHQRSGQTHGGCDDQHREGQVQRTDIANEVLVVRTVDRDPAATETREVVIERSRSEHRPQPDLQRDQREVSEGDSRQEWETHDAESTVPVD